MKFIRTNFKWPQ